MGVFFVMNSRKYLELRCISGRNLMAADSNGLSDPYIEACLGSKKKQKTKVIKKTLDPNWNQLLTFEVHNPDIEPVHITVLDKDLFKSDYLGEITVDISDLIEGYEKIITCKLTRATRGEITIGLKAVNWTGSQAQRVSQQQALMAQSQYQPVQQFPQQPQYQQPGFYSQAPFAPQQMFQFPPQAQEISYSNPYNPVPFYAPVNAAQMIPGYNPQQGMSQQQQPMPQQPPMVQGQASMAQSAAKSNVGQSALREGFSIAYSEIKFTKKIGAGAFGEVWKGEWAGTDVAVKKILKNDIKESDLGEFASEILLMSKLRHPNIVQFLGACMDPEFCLVTEFMHRGSLFDVLGDKSIEMDWDRKLQICMDVCKGMVYLHTRNPPIIHRDIKSLNVLVTKDWKSTIADFGLTKIKDKAMLSTRCGSPAWSAPEVLRGEPYDEKADVFSFGIVLWEVISRQRPYPNENPMQLIGRVAFQKPSLRPPIPDCEYPGMIDLMIRCWHDVPGVRPTFEQALQQLKEIQENPTAGVDIASSGGSIPNSSGDSIPNTPNSRDINSGNATPDDSKQNSS